METKQHLPFVNMMSCQNTLMVRQNMSTVWNWVDCTQLSALAQMGWRLVNMGKTPQRLALKWWSDFRAPFPALERLLLNLTTDWLEVVVGFPCSVSGLGVSAPESNHSLAKFWLDLFGHILVVRLSPLWVTLWVIDPLMDPCRARRLWTFCYGPQWLGTPIRGPWRNWFCVL